LFDACRRLPGAFDLRTRKTMDECAVGITDAFAGVARSGSVCVCIDYDYAGFVSLLSRFHVAVLPVENIVERPGDLFRPDCLNGDGLRRNFVFITGPSATADMGPLVRGVHGPHRLHVILV
jgi:L-lactate dehydrogenase complex protein LldG